MKHIVHIYGPCGSGTSTLGREIGRRLRFRFLDTDDFFWLPTDPQYTQKRPLEERLALLEEGGATVAEVASQVGFSNPAYFSKVFRARMGRSPREYQKQGAAVGPEGGDAL
jgi:AraC-like DNA-binding protein